MEKSLKIVNSFSLNQDSDSSLVPEQSKEQDKEIKAKKVKHNDEESTVQPKKLKLNDNSKLNIIHIQVIKANIFQSTNH